MKKTIAAIILLVSLAASLGAQADPFLPLNPSTIGRGGSYTAGAEGYNSFFYNPAGFARKPELTLTSVNAWTSMDAGLAQFLLGVATGEANLDALTGGTPSPNTSFSLGFQPRFQETTNETPSDPFNPFALIGDLTNAGVLPESLGSIAKEFEELQTTTIKDVDPDSGEVTERNFLELAFSDGTAPEEDADGNETVAGSGVQGVLNQLTKAIEAEVGEDNPLASLFGGGSSEDGEEGEEFDPLALFADPAIQETLENVTKSESFQSSLVDLTSEVNEAVERSIKKVEENIQTAKDNGKIDEAQEEELRTSALTATTQTAQIQIDPEVVSEESLNNLASEIAEGFLPSGNIRVGALVGLGWTGGGFGLGFFAGAGLDSTGADILQANAIATARISAVVGFGFDLFEGFSLGFALRPSLLGFQRVGVQDVLNTLTADSGGAIEDLVNFIYAGVHFGLDVGMLWDIGPLTLGASLQDILPLGISYEKYTLDELSSAVSGGTPMGTPVSPDTELFQPPGLKLNIGAEFHPDLGFLSRIIDPKVSIDILDLFNFVRIAQDEAEEFDPLSLVSLGAEVNFFGQLLSVRGGIYRDFLTIGAGVKLLFVDVDVAAFAKPLPPERVKDRGKFFSDNFSEFGFSIEAALRF